IDQGGARPRRLAGHGRGRGKGLALRPSHVHGADRAARPARGARAGQEVVRLTAAAIWHDVECASYEADLPLWRELAARARGPILDLGCGTGRVALDLAARGHDVTGLDCEPSFVQAMSARARERGVRVRAELGDARAF